LAFLTSMRDKRKSTPSSAIQVKNWQKMVDIEEKLDVISQPEKGERIGDIWHKGRHTHISIRRICDNADRIKESAESLDNIKWQPSETGSVCV